MPVAASLLRWGEPRWSRFAAHAWGPGGVTCPRQLGIESMVSAFRERRHLTLLGSNDELAPKDSLVDIRAGICFRTP